jgi:hypothetical protein
VIRIHSCSDGTFLQEFKRGMEKAKINSICFDNDTKFMAVSSSRGTIHIFSMGSTIKRLKEHEINKKNEEKDKDDKKKDKKDKKKKEDKKEEKKEDNINIEKEIKINENKKNEEKSENKIENDKNNDEDNQNKIEIDNTNENKIEEDKKENKINGNANDANKNKDKKDSIKQEESKEEDNVDIKINNEEKKIEINKKEFTETPEEEKLPENTKTFLGSIFGSKIEKSFAKIRIRSQESICAFINTELLAIVTSDNKYYKYKIDTKNGGDCKLLEEKKLTLNK